MSLVELKVDRNLIRPNFDGYKLSFDPVPVLRQPLHNSIPPNKLQPHSNQYSLLHSELFAKHNLLYSDPWARHNCYYINSQHQLLLCSYAEQLGEARPQRIVYDGLKHDELRGDYNYTLRFISEKLCVLCDGSLGYQLLDTGDRERGATWKLLASSPINPDAGVVERGFVLHDARLDVLQERKQITLIAGHIGKRAEEFVTQLTWSRWNWQQEQPEGWSYEICQQLATKGSVYYCALEPRAQSLIVCSNSELQTPEQHQQSLLDAAAAAAETTSYDWQQTAEELSVSFQLAADATSDDLQINSTANELLVLHKTQLLIEGVLFATVDEEHTNWTLEDNVLKLNFVKQQSQHWPSLLQLQTTTLPIPQLEEPIEDCDLPLDVDIKLVRFNLAKSAITHSICLGAMPPLFTTTLRPGFPAAFATRHDVDAAVWLQHFQATRPDEWSVRHEGQLPAFGYVLASKEQRKFVDCCPQLDYAVICEGYRHVFVYKPHNEAADGLRNRSGPQILIGKQHLVTLPEDVGEVLGLVTAPKVIMLLTERAMLYLQV